MIFRKPWLRVKLVNFDFSAKSSSTDHNESNKPTPKSLAHIWNLRNRLLSLEVPKNELFHFFTFFTPLKVSFSSWAVGNVKSSSTDYNESNNPNLKSLAHIGSEKSLVGLGIQKNDLFHFFHIFRSTKSLLFHLKPRFPKMHHISRNFGRIHEENLRIFWVNLENIWNFLKHFEKTSYKFWKSFRIWKTVDRFKKF